MFNGLSSAYSLVNVVAEQIEMLLQNGEEVSIIVTENCPDSDRTGIFADERINWIKLPHNLDGEPIKLQDYSDQELPLHDTFNQEADFLADQFAKAIEGNDVCIVHDILYLGIYYLYNVALRRAQKKLPQVRFLAFSHSFPLKRPLVVPPERSGRFTPMDNTLYVYPSRSGLAPLAKQYNVPEGLCRVVYNTTPLISGCCEAVRKLDRDFNLLDTELLIVYPGRLSVGKRFEKVAALAGTLKQTGEKTTKVIFCDAPAVEGEANEYKKAIRLLGRFYGLDDQDICFTSEHGHPYGFPRQGVLELFSLSNLFICPSFSETFSLTTLEAAQKGNFLILNESVAALRELGETLGAYFMRWDALGDGFRHRQQYSNGERAYYQKHVPIILRRMREAGVCRAKTMVRTRFNNQWVWKNQLEPLLLEGTTKVKTE